MSKRPINEKRAARLRKAMTRTPLPGYVDLIHWLRSRKIVNTAGDARKLILAGRLRVDSHPVGITTEQRPNATGTKLEDVEVVDRFLPIERAKGLQVVAPATHKVEKPATHRLPPYGVRAGEVVPA